MKKTASKTGAFVGAGIGLALFALFGLLYGTFIGGVVGLHLSGYLFGTSADFSILSRMVLAFGVMLGVFFAAIVCVTGSAIVGYVVGCTLDLVHMETKSILKTHAAVK